MQSFQFTVMQSKTPPPMIVSNNSSYQGSCDLVHHGTERTVSLDASKPDFAELWLPW